MSLEKSLEKVNSLYSARMQKTLSQIESLHSVVKFISELEGFFGDKGWFESVIRYCDDNNRLALNLSSQIVETKKIAGYNILYTSVNPVKFERTPVHDQRKMYSIEFLVEKKDEKNFTGCEWGNPMPANTIGNGFMINLPYLESDKQAVEDLQIIVPQIKILYGLDYEPSIYVRGEKPLEQKLS